MNDLDSGSKAAEFLNSVGGIILTKENAQRYIEILEGYVNIGVDYGRVIPSTRISVREEMVIAISTSRDEGNILGYVLDTNCPYLLVRDNYEIKDYISFENLPEDMRAFFEEKEIDYRKNAFEVGGDFSKKKSNMIMLDIYGVIHTAPRYKKYLESSTKISRAPLNFSEVQKMSEEELKDLIKNHFDGGPGDFLKMVDRSLDIFKTFKNNKLMLEYIKNRELFLKSQKDFYS